MTCVLLAGASGALGWEVDRALRSHGIAVKRLMRSNGGASDWLADLRHPESVRGACEGVDAVISCAGASMNLNQWGNRAGFREIDFRGNRSLLEEAKRSAVSKFVYVSLNDGPKMLHTAYGKWHEAFVDCLADSGLQYSVIRPTGLYSFFGEILEIARKGHGVVIGHGDARTNPIHHADAAQVCVEALYESRVDFPIGGPEILTRKQIVEMAFEALGTAPRLHFVPGWMMGAAPAIMRLFNQRIAELTEFGAAVSQVDCIAPPSGERRLADYFRELAQPGSENGRRHVSGRSSAVSA